MTQFEPQRQQAEQGAARPPLMLAGAGGVLVVLAFFALPLLDLPMVGSVTVPSLINFVSMFGVSELNWLWLVPVGALVIAVCGLGAGVVASSSLQARGLAVSVVQIVAALLGLAYIALPFILTEDKFISAGTSAQVMTSVLSSGYWVGLVGLLIAFGSAVAAGASLRRARSA